METRDNSLVCNGLSTAIKENNFKSDVIKTLKGILNHSVKPYQLNDDEKGGAYLLKLFYALKQRKNSEVTEFFKIYTKLLGITEFECLKSNEIISLFNIYSEFGYDFCMDEAFSVFGVLSGIIFEKNNRIAFFKHLKQQPYEFAKYYRLSLHFNSFHKIFSTRTNELNFIVSSVNNSKDIDKLMQFNDFVCDVFHNTEITYTITPSLLADMYKKWNELFNNDRIVDEKILATRDLYKLFLKFTALRADKATFCEEMLVRLNQVPISEMLQSNFKFTSFRGMDIPEISEFTDLAVISRQNKCASLRFLEFVDGVYEIAQFSENLKNTDSNLVCLWAAFYAFNYSNIVNYPKEIFSIFDSNDLKTVKLGDVLWFVFAKYEMPDFVIDFPILFNSENIHIFFHIARGENLRDAPGLKINLSKKQAHFIMHIKSREIINNNIKDLDTLLLYGKLKCEGVNYAAVIAKSRFSQYLHSYKIFNAYVSFFRNNQIQFNQIDPLFDYIIGQNIIREDFLIKMVKNRSWKTLEKEMNEWHRELTLTRRLGYSRNTSWSKVNINDFFVEVYGEKYIIQQLTTAIELFDEGRVMHHCVVSYIKYCVRGEISIWSLRKVYKDENNEKKKESLVTIELGSDKSIRQARAKCNKRPGKTELLIIREWCKVNNLEFK